MIGDFLLVLGLPAVITSLIWFIQKVLGNLSPPAKYLRRRIYGFVVIAILLVGICMYGVLVITIFNAGVGNSVGSSIGRGIGRFVVELIVLYALGMRNEDGFLRAVFIPYSSLSPQAKARLISGTTQ
jgi:hypothetical protein